MSTKHTHGDWRGKFEDGCPRCIAMAKAPAAPQPHYDATCPCGKYVFGIPSAVAAPTDTPSDSVMVPRELIEGAIRVAELWSTESSVAIGLRKLLAAAPATRKP